MPSVSVDLEFTPAQMRSMADAVVARCVAHIASLPEQPACGDVDARRVGDLCRAMKESAPEQGSALEPLLDRLFAEWIPRSFTAAGPGYVAFIPGGGLFPAALADFIADGDQSLHRRLAGRAGTGPARSQRARLAARLDGVSASHARTVHDGRIDGDVQRDRVRARTDILVPRFAVACSTPPIRRTTPVLKSAKLAGIMPDRVRAIATDDRYRLRIDALRAQVAEDRRAGLTPFAVVSSAGTTNTGAVDPLEAIADLCGGGEPLAPHRRRLRRVLLSL